MKLTRISNARRLATTLVAIASAAHVAFAQTAHTPVVVRLHRPAVVGYRARVDVTGEAHQTLLSAVAGRTVQQRHDDRHAHLIAVERVIAVDANGSSTQSEYTVERFEYTGSSPFGLHAGQVVGVTRGDTPAHATVTIDGQRASQDQRDSLEAVMTFSVSPVTDDDVFGNPQPQFVGATWALHGDVAARDLTRVGVTATMSGQTLLAARRMDHGVDVLDVTASMTGHVTAIPNMPAGAVIRTGVLAATFRGIVPVATSAPAHKNEMTLHMEVVMDFQINSQPAEVSVVVDQNKHETDTPM